MIREAATEVIVAPFIDLQVNGSFGVDFSAPDVTYGEMRDCCAAIIERGTTALLPTLPSCPMEVYRRNLPLLARLCVDPLLEQRVVGIHLEGPFLVSDERVLGAHRAGYILAPDPRRFDELQQMAEGRVALLTIAAETSEAPALARHVVASGVQVSIGHSYFDGEMLEAMYAAGARSLTHLGNALPRFLDKLQNPLLAGLVATNYLAMFIGDGLHLSPELLRLLMLSCGPQRLTAVSDASPVAGLAPGAYVALGQEVELHDDGRVANDVEGHLVGSSVDLLGAMNVLLRHGICGPAACVQIAAYNPLRVLRLAPGRFASMATAVYSAAERRFVPVQPRPTRL